jgi:hypothetical protein
MIGKFATSKAGHDKTKLYIIINEDLEYVYLVDGDLKPLDKPKKKSKKHIQIINKVDEIIQNKLETKQIIYNEDIKRAIKLYWR